MKKAAPIHARKETASQDYNTPNAFGPCLLCGAHQVDVYRFAVHFDGGYKDVLALLCPCCAELPTDAFHSLFDEKLKGLARNGQMLSPLDLTMLSLDFGQLLRSGIRSPDGRLVAIPRRQTPPLGGR